MITDVLIHRYNHLRYLYAEIMLVGEINTKRDAGRSGPEECPISAYSLADGHHKETVFGARSVDELPEGNRPRHCFITKVIGRSIAPFLDNELDRSIRDRGGAVARRAEDKSCIGICVASSKNRELTHDLRRYPQGETPSYRTISDKRLCFGRCRTLHRGLQATGRSTDSFLTLGNVSPDSSGHERRQVGTRGASSR